MRIADPYLEELNAEAPTTRRVLERVPEAHLEWRPHAKSMSLGQLALHVATLPRQLTEFVAGDELDFGAAGVLRRPSAVTRNCSLPSWRARNKRRPTLGA
jgi:hypothetical protein